MALQTGAPGFRIRRVTLVADVLTEVYAPATGKAVSVGNATSGDLEVHTHLDETEFLVIAAGYERTFPVDRDLFSPTRIAFWLRAVVAGTVVIVWY